MGYEDVRFERDAVFLVTGGAGFIGSGLCEALLNMGHAVRCLDDLSTGREENVAGLRGDTNFTFISGDVRDLTTCVEASVGADYVLHQAAWGSVPRSIEHPVLYGEINIKGTLNMLEASRRNGVRKFVYASSSSVYGDSEILPKKEGSEGRPLSPYALTKRVCEEYGTLYAHAYGLDTYGLRYFNVFGRRQDPDGPYAAVIPRFIRQLLRGEASRIDGDGLQSRDFTYVDNVIEANLKACHAAHEDAGEVMNVAFGGRETVMEVYHHLAEALGINAEPVFGPERPGDVRHSSADITKARALLGYDPSYSFADGITLAIDWYKEHLS